MPKIGVIGEIPMLKSGPKKRSCSDGSDDENVAEMPTAKQGLARHHNQEKLVTICGELLSVVNGNIFVNQSKKGELIGFLTTVRLEELNFNEILMTGPIPPANPLFYITLGLLFTNEIDLFEHFVGSIGKLNFDVTPSVGMFAGFSLLSLIVQFKLPHALNFAEVIFKHIPVSSLNLAIAVPGTDKNLFSILSEKLYLESRIPLFINVMSKLSPLQIASLDFNVAPSPADYSNLWLACDLAVKGCPQILEHWLRHTLSQNMHRFNFNYQPGYPKRDQRSALCVLTEAAALGNSAPLELVLKHVPMQQLNFNLPCRNYNQPQPFLDKSPKDFLNRVPALQQLALRLTQPSTVVIATPSSETSSALLPQLQQSLLQATSSNAENVGNNVNSGHKLNASNH